MIYATPKEVEEHNYVARCAYCKKPIRLTRANVVPFDVDDAMSLCSRCIKRYPFTTVAGDSFDEHDTRMIISEKW